MKPTDNSIFYDKLGDLWNSSSEAQDSMNNQSESEDANVSDEQCDEEDMYEYNPISSYGSPALFHQESSLMRNSFQEKKT